MLLSTGQLGRRAEWLLTGLVKKKKPNWCWLAVHSPDDGRGFDSEERPSFCQPLTGERQGNNYQDLVGNLVHLPYSIHRRRQNLKCHSYVNNFLSVFFLHLKNRWCGVVTWLLTTKIAKGKFGQNFTFLQWVEGVKTKVVRKYRINNNSHTENLIKFQAGFSPGQGQEHIDRTSKVLGWLMPDQKQWKSCIFYFKTWAKFWRATNDYCSRWKERGKRKNHGDKKKMSKGTSLCRI